MTGRTALIIGATGLTGEECLKQILQSSVYSKVVTLTRKELQTSNVKLEKIVIDFDRTEEYKTKITADDIFCCIGTTIGKAGSKEAFKKVDFDIPLQIAETALWNGAKKFILISSLGADARSGVFYSRIKGKLEEALKNLNYESLVIFRPSILLGDRKEKRTGEEIGKWAAEKLSFLFAGPLRKYRGTPVNILAKAMLHEAEHEMQKVRIIENDEIFVLGGK